MGADVAEALFMWRGRFRLTIADDGIDSEFWAEHEVSRRLPSGMRAARQHRACVAALAEAQHRA